MRSTGMVVAGVAIMLIGFALVTGGNNLGVFPLLGGAIIGSVASMPRIKQS